VGVAWGVGGGVVAILTRVVDEGRKRVARIAAGVVVVAGVGGAARQGQALEGFAVSTQVQLGREHPVDVVFEVAEVAVVGHAAYHVVYVVRRAVAFGPGAVAIRAVGVVDGIGKGCQREEAAVVVKHVAAVGRIHAVGAVHRGGVDLGKVAVHVHPQVEAFGHVDVQVRAVVIAALVVVVVDAGGTAEILQHPVLKQITY
nr:hypothetical protein [Tanacetum cinerariifolium]